jgi:predicted phage terminase large subunit-like protein
MSESAEAYALAVKLEARADLYFFSRYMFKSMRGYRWLHNWHHRTICDALMRVYRGECKRLIINIPPRYSKTELAVVNFIAWALGLNPDAEFIHTSYSDKLSVNNAANAKRIVEHEAYRGIFPEVQLRRDSNAKGEWRTTAGGVVYAQGEGGTITGFGAGKLRPGFGGAIIIDDIHKAAEAKSDVIREGVIEWFKNTLESRVNSPDTPIIVIGQRLHERDLPGWLLNGGNGEEWELLKIPAIQPDGTALWPAKHDIATLRRMEEKKPYEFAGQYAQEPAPKEGGLFKKHWFKVVDAAPAGGTWVRKWDLAGTEEGATGDPDWTVGCLMSKCPDGFFWVRDIIRFRGSPHEVEQAVQNTATLDGKNVAIHLNQDPAQAGKAQAKAFTRMLAGWIVKAEVESGSKETRAAPFSAQCEAGNVRLVKAPWNEGFITELCTFPNAAKDDQVDAASGAFNYLAPGSGLEGWLSWAAETTTSAEQSA